MNHSLVISGLVLAFVGMATIDSSALDRPPAPSEELNTLLMHTTFRIAGPKARMKNSTSFGTVFIMAVPIKDKEKLGAIVLVTAAHVLDDIDGDTASILLRKPRSDGNYTPFPFDLRIRDNGRPLYVKHSSADVAAMYADFPDEVPMTGLVPEMLADDAKLKAIEFHPGDEVFVLGFPLAATGPGAFPILRTGHVASYPITPMKTVKDIYVDLFIYGGNSGGPVYYSSPNRIFDKQIHLGLWQGILGLVTQETRSVLPEFADKPINFGIIVPAVFIKETIELLPPPPNR